MNSKKIVANLEVHNKIGVSSLNNTSIRRNLVKKENNRFLKSRKIRIKRKVQENQIEFMKELSESIDIIYNTMENRLESTLIPDSSKLYVITNTQKINSSSLDLKKNNGELIFTFKQEDGMPSKDLPTSFKVINNDQIQSLFLKLNSIKSSLKKQLRQVKRKDNKKIFLQTVQQFNQEYENEEFSSPQYRKKNFIKKEKAGNHSRFRLISQVELSRISSIMKLKQQFYEISESLEKLQLLNVIPQLKIFIKLNELKNSIKNYIITKIISIIKDINDILVSEEKQQTSQVSKINNNDDTVFDRMSAEELEAVNQKNRDELRKISKQVYKNKEEDEEAKDISQMSLDEIKMRSIAVKMVMNEETRKRLQAVKISKEDAAKMDMNEIRISSAKVIVTIRQILEENLRSFFFKLSSFPRRLRLNYYHNYNSWINYYAGDYDFINSKRIKQYNKLDEIPVLIGFLQKHDAEIYRKYIASENINNIDYSLTIKATSTKLAKESLSKTNNSFENKKYGILIIIPRFFEYNKINSKITPSLNYSRYLETGYGMYNMPIYKTKPISKKILYTKNKFFNTFVRPKKIFTTLYRKELKHLYNEYYKQRKANLQTKFFYKFRDDYIDTTKGLIIQERELYGNKILKIVSKIIKKIKTVNQLKIIKNFFIENSNEDGVLEKTDLFINKVSRNKNKINNKLNNQV